MILSDSAQKSIISSSDPYGLPKEPLPRLLAIMARLRDPQGGCPWDLKQTYASLARHAIEEAYEVADAAERSDFEALREELGDLLLQVVFYSQVASEDSKFDFNGVAAAIADKLVRRHPHVFGDETVATAEAMVTRWEADKAKERLAKTENMPERASTLDGVMASQPALSHAHKLVQRVARVGFDYPDANGAFQKLAEEINELQHEVKSNDKQRQHDEFGDVIFTVVCVAHKLGIDSETALRAANRKFERRFRAMEATLARKEKVNEPLALDIWELAWQKVKELESK